ncbi:MULTISPECIES: hypothetical protein [unclassified Microbacterium]|uniref:hypothetical protein n=1 Tax=unclassified Microbacterium TaxID=2609290 RepID=UPI003C2E3192
MTDPRHAGVAADEAAIESQYNDALASKAKRLRTLINQQTQNTLTSTTKVDLATRGELVGRVALVAPSELLDGARDFYIGTASYDGEDFQVWNWTAAIACTFYRKPDGHHELCDEVAGVRVLAHRGGRIVDFEDEAVGDAVVTDLFPKRKLQVPRAPVPRPVTASVALEDSLSPVTGESGSTSTPPSHGAWPKGVESAPEPPKPTASVAPGPAIRTPDLLRRQLSAPKSAAMSAVLATLQSDQYQAITRPAAESQVLQGHPGTGKTIIAAHRAAYLLSDDVPKASTPKGHVLLLGPTVEYVEHVRSALRKLIGDDQRYEVKALPDLLEDLAELPRSAAPTNTFVWEDVSPELARLIDIAYARARAELNDAGEKPTSSDVYAELLWLLQDPPAEGLEPEWVAYLRELPSNYGELKRRRISSYRGLMAYIGARTSRTPDPGHVIVDEAQDIHPIEWETLGWLGNTGGWTILGDMNQRRTDHTFASWDDVATIFGIEDDRGKAPVQILQRGYRSTSQIIRFANQLLPGRERTLYSLQQDGEIPTVQRAMSPNDLVETTMKAAETLQTRVGAGTVAIVTMSPTSVRGALTRRGWKADVGDPFTWRGEAKTLKLLPPERARGLEFDGVVVVEPADFPENVGRQGTLYTALTRANRLLTVVHHKPLPRGMKAHP